MIIKCLKDGDLELSATRLTEISKYINRPYYIVLKEWISKPDSFKVRTVNPGVHQFHPGYEGGFSIGCRHFEESVYKKIVRAAKKAAGVKPVRKTKARKAKKGTR